MKSRVLLIVGLGILMVGLFAAPELWAAPGQDPARQTVPTRTPVPEPTEVPSKDKDDKDEAQQTPIPQATPAVLSEATPPAEVPEVILPEAGGRRPYSYLGAAMIVVGLLALVARRQRL
jgi:hypothetical protein